MKHICLVLVLFLAGCRTGSATDVETSDYVRQEKQSCFDTGGTEFQYGLSGGRTHSVCIFRKEGE